MVGQLIPCRAIISKPLKLLRDAGLVTHRKQGAQVHYQVADPMISEMCGIGCENLNRDEQKPARLKS